MQAIKCVIDGESGVGKTSLCHTYANGTFPDGYLIFDNYSNTVQVDGTSFNLGLWDFTPRSDQSERMRPLDWTQTDVHILAFDISRPHTFEQLKMKWYPLLKHHSSSSILILMNRSAFYYGRIEKRFKRR